jgi:hypothetical protein
MLEKDANEKIIQSCESGMIFPRPDPWKQRQVKKAVLRIHDILGWIRIRILGSIHLTNGSCYFRHWPSRCRQKTNTIFSAYYFLKLHLHYFSKIKSQKEQQNSRNQGFSYYFCMMIEGAGSGSGSKHLTCGSGSGRPKNMWIRWIRIRIRNTAKKFIIFIVSTVQVTRGIIGTFLRAFKGSSTVPVWRILVWNGKCRYFILSICTRYRYLFFTLDKRPDTDP